MRTRRTVTCWYCGHKARRRPSGEKIGVIGRRRKIQPYGTCGAMLAPDEGYVCGEPMFTPEDTAFVLRSAVRWDSRGGNK